MFSGELVEAYKPQLGIECVYPLNANEKVVMFKSAVHNIFLPKSMVTGVDAWDAAYYVDDGQQKFKNFRIFIVRDLVNSNVSYLVEYQSSYALDYFLTLKSNALKDRYFEKVREEAEALRLLYIGTAQAA
jgi:hypothetical protein